MLEYKDKKITQRGFQNVTMAASEIGSMLMDKRTKTPTLYGWILLIVLFFVLLNAYRGRVEQDLGKTPEQIQESRPDRLRFQPHVRDIEPIIFDDPDPQLKEFEDIANKNKDPANLPEIPIFNPDLHPEVHNHPGPQEVEKHGLPQPKDFPVPLLQTPRLVCDNKEIELLVLVMTRPETGGTRRAIRKTWGRHEAERFPFGSGNRKWATIFVMGESSKYPT